MMKRTTRWLALAMLALPTYAAAQQSDAPTEAPEATETAPAETSVVEPEAPEVTPVTTSAAPVAATSSRPTSEIRCNDGHDDDGDSLADCADADCYDNPVCAIGQGEERNDARCSDWVDNDGDGAVDCEDADCQGPGITICHGSAEDAGSHADLDVEVGHLTGDETTEDLIGRGTDADGERNDYMCSDGIDNDGDGRTDCADFGCRFDPQVTVCTQNPSFRFSVVAGVGASYDLQQGLIADGADSTSASQAADVNFRRLQVRALGPIPFINNSFFLLSMRLEKSPRLTFAHFQVPIGDNGHYFALNSGSGSLSSGLIISTGKQALLDPPFYLFNAFEQGNGAALEFGGPLIPSGRIAYRAFLGGGSGRFNGNVGGRFFPNDNRNFTYTAGAQVQFNLVGHYNRFDSRLPYTTSPTSLALVVGAKWDQRATERYPAVNALVNFRYGRIQFSLENYFKYTLDYGGSAQNAWNAALSVLLVPRTLVFAVDGGMYTAQDFDDLPGDTDHRQPLNEYQFRTALHWFWFRNIGLLSLLYTETHNEDIPDRDDDQEIERNIRLEAQFRF